MIVKTLTLKEAKSYFETAYSMKMKIVIDAFIDPAELPSISIESTLEDVKIKDYDDWGLGIELHLNDSFVTFYESYCRFEYHEESNLLFIYSENLTQANFLISIKG